jgi:hypothetical protein
MSGVSAIAVAGSLVSRESVGLEGVSATGVPGSLATPPAVDEGGAARTVISRDSGMPAESTTELTADGVAPTAPAATDAPTSFSTSRSDTAQTSDQFNATLTPVSFSPDRLAAEFGEISRIAGEMKALAPLIEQLANIQSNLGSNSRSMLVNGRQITLEDARILQLTGNILEREVRSQNPHHDIIAQCLLVGKGILTTALNVILSLEVSVVGNLIYDSIMHPAETHARVQALADSVMHMCSVLF